MKAHALGFGLLLSWLVVQPYYPDLTQPVVVRVWRAFWYWNTWTATFVYETKAECSKAAQSFRDQAMHRLKQGGNEAWATLMLAAEAKSRCVPADAVPILPYNVRAHEMFDSY
jgi:hypothetical protein